MVIHVSSAPSGACEKGAIMAEQDFGEFTVETVRRPVSGTTPGEIPPALAKLLESKYTEVLGEKGADFELVLNAADAAKASKLAAYAKAWGAQHDPKLYVKKLPNTRAHKDSQARLSVQVWAEVPAENRPGRRNAPAGSGK
jgi:hypothetical protein